MGTPLLMGCGVFSSPLLLDTFTDANGTDLAVHTMDKGPGWTVNGATHQINSNQLDLSGGGVLSPSWSDAGQADVTITADVTIDGTTGNGNAGPVWRVTDASNFWMLWLHKTLGWQIREVNAGTATVRSSGSFVFGSGTTQTVTIVVSGTSASVTCGANNLSYGSMGSGLTSTKHGLAGSDLMHYDNFKVSHP